MKKTGAQLISDERDRQIAEEGWTPLHDTQHLFGELSLAAASYCVCAANQILGESASRWTQKPVMWPWDDEAWKPNDSEIRNLQKAGALIAAEIDRLQRQG